MRSICAFAVLVALVACTRNSDDAFVASAHRVRPSVVLLKMKIPPEHRKDKYDEAYATGFVVASGTWGSDVLTVQHAIDDAWDLSITIDDKRRVPAHVVAADANLDVALLRTPQKNLPVLALGSSAHLRDDLGRQVGLIGYPIPDEFDDEGLGLTSSTFDGRLSSIRPDALEVTLSIVPGESGAPVFIAGTGEVVGVAESRFDEEHGIGFALPIDDAKKFLHGADAAHGF
ncbi:MAG TPA: serine protease [Candidatus Baltobacteraceae bacterium]|jgi:serine protease Do|nr:serine protease [Candidatus Baltobacteraceae bacterium]